ncbi:MAG: helix-turn-helix transcriptional regulator [Clostridia bacterium]
MLADRIKQLRERLGISQSQVAKKLQVSRSSVSSWEMGLTMPTSVYLIELAKLFRCSTDYILGVEEGNKLSLNGLTNKQIQTVMQVIECFK